MGRNLRAATVFTLVFVAPLVLGTEWVDTDYGPLPRRPVNHCGEKRPHVLITRGDCPAPMYAGGCNQWGTVTENVNPFRNQGVLHVLELEPAPFWCPARNRAACQTAQRLGLPVIAGKGIDLSRPGMLDIVRSAGMSDVQWNRLQYELSVYSKEVISFINAGYRPSGVVTVDGKDYLELMPSSQGAGDCAAPQGTPPGPSCMPRLPRLGTCFSVARTTASCGARMMIDGADEAALVCGTLGAMGGGSIVGGINMLPACGVAGLGAAGGLCVATGVAFYYVGNGMWWAIETCFDPFGLQNTNRRSPGPSPDLPDILPPPGGRIQF